MAGARAADAAGGLGFPDLPRLELDQLLVQLADRADDVRATQGRLRGLLRANALVASELSLPVVLRQIVGAARDLLGARYAALGVLGPDAGLEQFVHAGLDEELVARIGDLPTGRGILGLLISEPVPIRLADQLILAQAEDHDRIAGDLHDHVIQELFALGMTLQGHAARSDPADAERIKGYIDTLDGAIANIRTSIFGLHQSRAAAPAGLYARLLAIIEEHAPQLGFAAAIRFAGPLDPGPDAALAHDILAVTREALSNCARHARATAVSISLAQQDGLVILDVIDNGRGIGIPARSSGLASMRGRAERNGGTFNLITPGSGGTQLTWTGRLRRV